MIVADEISLVEHGRIRRGVFERPFRAPRFERIDLSGRGPSVFFLRARQRFWYGFALTHPEVHLATILIDLGAVVVSSFYVHEKRLGTHHEYSSMAFGGRGRVAEHPYADRSYVHAHGHCVDFHHHLDAFRHSIRHEVAATRHTPRFESSLVMHEDARVCRPLVVSVPMRGPWFMYTHKAHAPASGTLRVGDREYRLDPARDFLSIDEHKAAYPYVQEWKWGSFVGRKAGGTAIGANLCTNVHYTDSDRVNENRLWVGDTMHRLGAVSFDLDDGDPRAPWRVTDALGGVDLTFSPNGRKVQKTGAGPYRLDYFQAYGTYRGRLRDASGQFHAVEDLFGVAERGIGRN